jgi:hypothetical protein
MPLNFISRNYPAVDELLDTIRFDTYTYYHSGESWYTIITMNGTTGDILFTDTVLHDSVHSVYYWNNQPEAFIVYLGSPGYGIKDVLRSDGVSNVEYSLEHDDPAISISVNEITPALITQLNIEHPDVSFPSEYQNNLAAHLARELLINPMDWQSPRTLSNQGKLLVVSTGRRAIQYRRDHYQASEGMLSWYLYGKSMKMPVRYKPRVVNSHRLLWLCHRMNITS